MFQLTNRLVTFVFFILLIFLVSCLQGPAEETDAIAVPTAATLLSEPSIAPSPTISEQLTMPPTVTRIQPAGDPTEVLETTTPGLGVCQFSYFFEPAPPSCPSDEPLVSAAAEQPFEGGVMIWLEATDSIYVFFDDQSWRRFDDTWSEGQPESDPAIIAPGDRFQPIRGFGKVWREHPEVRQHLRWALGIELAFESALQSETAAEGNAATIFLLTFNGQVFALISRDTDQGEWVIAAS